MGRTRRMMLILVTAALVATHCSYRPLASAPNGSGSYKGHLHPPNRHLDDQPLDLLNDGSTASVGLIMKATAQDSPETTVYLTIWQRSRLGKRQVYSHRIGTGTGGSVHVGHLTGGSSVEVFTFVDGQKTEAALVRFRSARSLILYRLDEGRPHVFLRWRTDTAGCPADVVECWPVGQLGLESDPRFRLHQYALRVMRDDGHRYRLHHVDPSDARMCD